MSGYGTLKYYEEELAEAKLKYKLMNEAITERLYARIDKSMTKIYLKILQESQDFVDRCQKDYDKAVEESNVEVKSKN